MELLRRRRAETSKGEEKREAPLVTVGCDLGQRHDPTALCVTEAQLRPTGRELVTAAHEDGSLSKTPELAPFYAVRHLERRPLGTTYPDVAERLAEIVRKLERELGAQPKLVLDATGVGLPVVDMVREALQGSRCSVVAAVLTGSERLARQGRELRLGKLHLVSNLQALLQQELIGLPKTKEARQLADELLDFELRVNENANLISGAFRTGAHDDLVVALGLSVLEDPRLQRVGLGPLVA